MAPNPPPFPLHTFPNEIIDLITSHLSHRDRARCAQVCKTWHLVADNEQSYSAQFKRDFAPTITPSRQSTTSWKRAYVALCNPTFPYDEYVELPAVPHSKKNRAIERYWESRAGFDDEGFGTAAMWGWGSRGWDVEVCERAMVHGVSPRVEKMLAVRGWLLHHASNRRRVIYPGCGRGFHNLIGEMEAVKEKGLRCGGREV